MEVVLINVGMRPLRRRLRLFLALLLGSPLLWWGMRVARLPRTVSKSHPDWLLGTWKSRTGKTYHFEEDGSGTVNGSTPCQWTGSDGVLSLSLNGGRDQHRASYALYRDGSLQLHWDGGNTEMYHPSP